MFKASKKKALGQSIQDFESILGKSIRIDGNLIIKQSVRIDGSLNGNVLQEDGDEATVAVASGAKIIGDIRAKHIIIAGMVKGNIFSSGKIELISGAQVEGDITYREIGIDIGAKVTGKLLEIASSESSSEAELVLAQMKQKIIG